ncbi:MAG: deoxyribonuclease V [bacterium]|nr:deoxyribonuclease V [bacterium]
MKYPSLHSWTVTPQEAITIQNALRDQIRYISINIAWSKCDVIAGIDVGYSISRNQATAGVVVLQYPTLKIVESVTATKRIQFPYVPGLLTFREGPVILSAVRQLKTVPDVFLFDGQGIAHPRRMGIATHLGLWLNKPTIGCAKSLLYGHGVTPGSKRGEISYLFDEKESNEIIGAIVRTRTQVRPVYVSVGHKIDLKQAIEIVLTCTQKYRIPEPIRLAHILIKQKEKNR